jgi:glutathione S-transferase
LSFGKKEHKSPEVLALNPRGQVPTFKLGNTIINDSLAACDYIEVRGATIR